KLESSQVEIGNRVWRAPDRKLSNLPALRQRFPSSGLRCRREFAATNYSVGLLGVPAVRRWTNSDPKGGRDLSSGFRNFHHDLLVQPDVDCSSIVFVAGVVQFFCKLLARRETAVELEKLHEINDRPSPLELFLVLTGELRQDVLDVDRRLRRRRWWTSCTA